MMGHTRALVAETKAAKRDGDPGPLQAALDDALAAGMPAKCVAAAKARKLLRKLRKKEAPAAKEAGKAYFMKHAAKVLLQEHPGVLLSCLGNHPCP